ncbi:DsbA family oxidoreductase [Actinomadura sp. DC4]|uniref:DsbA family oxidoreductase n=1 Tax=Actinomadura sp. DC4 TaxID=3055069 RepID=UPI0025B05768|nr:DsbA family oxidoreductase [Actinomadura sp. DC4]MDN3358344.1 DsbA family oxidoreductase [Actinomadura sp. DC4]
MNIEIFSDVVCPWCYLGRARFSAAAKAHDGDTTVTWRPFQLDPSTVGGGLTSELLADRFGGPAKVAEMHAQMRGLMAAENLPYEPDTAISANTRDAHRVIALAGAAGVQDAVVDRLFRAYHAEGRDLNDHETLAELAAEGGLADAAELLAAGDGDAEVTEQLERARAVGVNGVPFYVFEGTWAVSGAQSVDFFESALREVAAQT